MLNDRPLIGQLLVESNVRLSQQTPKLNLPSPQRIAVFRALPGLGDFLCVVPVLRSLRMAFPQAKIVLIGLAHLRDLVHRFRQYVDDLVEFPGYPGLPEQPTDDCKFAEFLEIVHDRSFDLILQLHGNGSITNPLLHQFGAKHLAGYYPSEHPCPDENYFLPYEESASEVRRALQLLKFLGIPTQGEHLEFPMNREDGRALHRIKSIQSVLSRPYVCIHPGASVPSRRWPPEHFATVADRLASQGFQIVLTGSQAEAETTQAVATAMQFPYVNLTGMTNLGSLAALLSQARLLVCNDTGVSHLAAALRISSVVVFSDSDPQRWAPLDRNRHRIVTGKGSGMVNQAIVQATTLLQRSKPYLIA
ncbi:MAG: glycosyltransferase family 9 protein [Leptolyngbyaceae cyanobacterium bins.59]|nr:glycosyltransferase family 9 protein [Leptolyngbyaceae cyanobacterium bins.59]